MNELGNRLRGLLLYGAAEAAMAGQFFMTDEDTSALAGKTYKGKRGPILVVAWLIVFFEIFMIVSVVLKPGPINSSVSRFTYFQLYVSLLTFTLLCIVLLVLGRKWFEKKPKQFGTLCFVYAAAINLWGGYLTSYTHRINTDISVFLYISLAVAILIPLRPWQAILIYGVSWAFFFVMMSLYIAPELDPFSSQLNSAFTAILSACIAAMMYRSRVTGYISERTILEQSRHIQLINDQLNAMVTTDELTRIYNRRFMDREFPVLLEQARRALRPVALIMLDIDYFKQYNDCYGHQEGDTCLHRIASLIVQQLPRQDAYFVRYGGEEFLILLLGMDPENVRALAEQLRALIEKERLMHEKSPYGIVTVSLGVCCSRENGEATLSQMIRYADAAMYDAKNAGRNCIVSYRFTTPEDSRT